MGELNRRPDAPEPADRPEPSRTPDRVPKRVPAPVTGLRPRDAGAARAEIADLKAQTGADRSALARPDAHREADRPENDPKLDAAYAEIAELRRQVHARDTKLDAAETKIAEQDAKLDRQQARLDEQTSKLEAANAKIAEQGARITEQDTKIEGQENRLDALTAALSGVQERLTDVENRRPEERHHEAGLSRVDEPTAAVAEGDPVADEPKSPRNSLRGKVADTAVAGGGIFAAAMAIGPHMPAYVTALGATVAGAVKPTIDLYREWRTVRNADRPEG